MNRTIPTLVLFGLALVAWALPGASAGSIDQDCVEVDTHGDPITVGVSPSGCKELGRPVYNIWNEQCPWIFSNPALPPVFQCKEL